MKFLVFLVCFTLFIVLFLFLTRKYRNPYKLIMVFGKKGSGKSTYLVKQAIYYLKKGWIVYSNMPEMNIPGVRLINVDDIGDFVPEYHSVLLIDEVGMIWDSRDFKKFKPSVRDFFKLQRHYHVKCFLASQTYDVDKKLRDLTDQMILFINVFSVFSLGRPIQKKISLTEATAEGESRIVENLKFLPIWNWKVIYIPKFSKWYNSFEIPDMPLLKYTEISSESLLKD